MKDSIFFDLDGTLIDSRADIAAACNAMLEGHGYAPLPQARIETFVGDGARMLVARAVELPPQDSKVEALLEGFLSYYTEHAAHHTTLMPGALESLRALETLPLALCTNKPRRTTDAVLAALDLTHHFRVIVAGGDLPTHKPDPLPLRHIAEQLRLDPAELVMVGDGPQDILCGKAVGARTVGVEGGIIARDSLLAASPDVMLATLEELPAQVRAWTAS
jgi:phosphoglycolate phosphatase